jgi:hypothetical protein
MKRKGSYQIIVSSRKFYLFPVGLLGSYSTRMPSSGTSTIDDQQQPLLCHAHNRLPMDLERFGYLTEFSKFAMLEHEYFENFNRI